MIHSISTAGFILATTLCALVPIGAAAASTAGKLDPSFGTNGKAKLVSGVNNVGNAKLQPDGKIVVAAAIQNLNVATLAFGVVRLLPNGTLDPSFGHGGVVLTPVFSNFINMPHDLAIQPDGKIVVVGGAESADGSVNPVAIARYTANGTLDRSFGSGGTVTTSFANLDNADVVLLQPDGKIVIGGTALPADDEQPAQAILARYNPDGSLDAGFGTGGKVQGLLGNITALALQADGKILTNLGAPFVRVLPNGTVDSGDTGGTITATAYTVTGTFLPDGRFILAGQVQDFGSRHDIDVEMMRFSQSGTPDPTFSSPPLDFGSTGQDGLTYAAQSVAIQPNGQLLAGAVGLANFRAEFGIERLNADGSIDTGFGKAGQVLTRFSNSTGGGDVLDALVVQPDGKILAVGVAVPQDTAIPPKLAIARYLGQ